MTTTNTNNKFVTQLVVDSSAFIRQAPLHTFTDIVYTVEDIVKEIRDVKTRESLNVVLYTLKFKEPSSEAIRFVTNFAKKTGDYAFLSAVDLRLLSLTYQLYQESVGTDKLNLEPKINAAIPSSTVSCGNSGVKLAGFVFPKHEEKNTDNHTENSTSDNQTSLPDEETPLDNEDEEEEEEEEDKEDDIESFVTAADNENDLIESVNDLQLGHDDDGWITPANVKFVKSKALDNGVSDNSETIKETLPVACITTDFSMQNVLIQMGIPVLSVDGLLIRTARSYVLKCRVCPGVTRQMTKQFCPECGNPSLQRASVTIDSTGRRHYQLTGRYREKPRKSLPLPRGGKHSNDPIRVEGQPRAQNRPTKKSLAKRSVLDDDYLANSSPFAIHDIYSRAATLVIEQVHECAWNRSLSEKQMSDFDRSEVLDISPTVLTHDFIGLCIGILSVVFVILIVAICKWCRCLCLKRQYHWDDHRRAYASTLQQGMFIPDQYSRDSYQYYHSYYRLPLQRQSSSSYYSHPGSIYRYINSARDDIMSLPPYHSSRNRLTDIKAPRVTITTLPVQPSQQQVPCLSISAETSGSSITRSTNSFK